MTRALRSDEEDLATLLQKAGLSRPAARCLTVLARGGQWTSVILAESAGLSQPGVSQGMRELIDTQLAVRELKHSGEKGRPAHIYSLPTAPSDVLARAESARRLVLMAELKVLDELRAMIAKRA